MSDLPAPLTPVDCDLQDFPFMPLQVARLRDSDLAAEEHPEACWYAVLLWAASWHQLPAGSLPDNDTVLMKLCGLGRDVKTFRKHRAGALRGFVKCNDGRLYHPVVAEQAMAAWEGKLEQRWRTECARIKKHNQRHGSSIDCPTFGDFKAAGCIPMVLDRREMSSGTEGGSPQGQRVVSSGTEGGCPSGNTLQEKGKGKEKEEKKESPLPPEPQLPANLRAIMEEGGMVVPPNDLRRLDEWKALGADLQQDILPVVRKVRAKLSSPPRTLSIFDSDLKQKLGEDRAEIERLRRVSQRIHEDDRRQAAEARG